MDGADGGYADVSDILIVSALVVAGNGQTHRRSIQVRERDSECIDRGELAIMFGYQMSRIGLKPASEIEVEYGQSLDQFNPLAHERTK